MPSLREWIQLHDEYEAAGDNESARQIREALVAKGYLQAGAQSTVLIDDKQGLPMGQRAALGALQPTDQEAYLRQHYEDVRPQPGGGWAVKAPGSSTYVAANPAGLDWGDIAQYGRVGAEVLGGAVGGVMGGAAATPSVFGMPLGAVAGGAAGATTAGELYERTVRGLTGAEDTRGLGEQAGDAVASLAMNTAAPLVLGGLMRGGANTLRRATASSDAAEVLGAADRVGVRPTSGWLANPAAEKIEGVMSSLPFSSMRRAQGEATEQLGENAMRQLTPAGGLLDSPQQLGDFLLGRVQDWKKLFQSMSSALYRAVDDNIPADARMPIDNLQVAIGRLRGRYAADPDVGEIVESPLMKRLATLQGKPDVSYSALSGLRSDVGKALGQRTGPLVNDASTGELKLVYEALASDILAGARGLSDEALNAVVTADKFYASRIKTAKEVIDPLVKTARGPEDAWRRFEGSLRRGSTVIDDLVKGGVLTPDDLQRIGGSQAVRLGMARPGAQNADGSVFSPRTFLTELNKMSPEAKATLFTGKVGGTVDDVATLANAQTRASKGLNTSNTAPALLGAGSAMAVAVDPTRLAAFAALGLGESALTKLSRNRQFQQLLAGTYSPASPKWAAARKMLASLLVANGVRANQADEKAESLLSEADTARQMAALPPRAGAKADLASQPKFPGLGATPVRSPLL